MELGSWSLIQAPSLLALVPLIVMIILAFRGRHNAYACFAGIVVAALMMGQDLGDIAVALKNALASGTALIGFIIIMGAALGNIMADAGITRTMVYWIVKRIGVNTQTRAKICLIVCSILICGLLGTLGGGNAVIAPILIPIMASLGVVPSAVAALLKISGEIGLMVGPLTGVTLITCEVTGLSYSQLMLQAVLPFSAFWLAGCWIGANRVQKKLQGKESYQVDISAQDLDSIKVSPKESRDTIIFLVTFIALVAYGIITKQGTQYALAVMIVLSIVVAACARMNPDTAMKSLVKGGSSMMGVFYVTITIQALLNYVTLGGGFDALSNLLGGLSGNSPAAVMLLASLVGGFGIEAAAVAEIKIIAEMFVGMAANVGLPMGCFAVSILAATRLTGTAYPTSNFAGQMATARCENTRGALEACWWSVAFAVFFVVVYALVGPMILG